MIASVGAPEFGGTTGVVLWCDELECVGGVLHPVTSDVHPPEQTHVPLFE
jgi:hypothetical protein